MNKYWFFENINLFKILCPHKYKEFSDSHEFLEYKKNEYIYIQDDVSKNIFLVNSGCVKIGFWSESGEEIVTAYLEKGEVFGEEVILQETKRKEFAKSDSNDTSLCSITLQQAEDLVKDNKPFAVGIYKFINFKIKKIERRYKIMFFRSTRTRVLEFVKDLKEEDSDSKELLNGEILIRNPFSQSEIAKLIATSRQTFNSTMKELEKEDYFVWQKKQILLKNKFLSEI